jgi:hypothetical protein
MVFLDLDEVLIAFVKCLKERFGIDIMPGDYCSFHWFGSKNCDCEFNTGERGCGFPTPEEFYEVAELQPWFRDLIMEIIITSEPLAFITKDCVEIKKRSILKNAGMFADYCGDRRWFEAPDKSKHCTRRCDILIDDNPHEVAAWRAKGGQAFWWDVSKPDVFGDFLNNFWRLK